MEIVVIIIMCMVSFSFVLKLTCHGLAGRILTGLTAAIFILLTYDAAASQSKTQIEEWLASPELMLDTSVLLTVDVAFQICFCMLAARALRGPMRQTEKILLQITLWIPGLLIFPTLFSLLTELIFSFTGVDFAVTAWTTAGAVSVLAPALGGIMKYLVPETDIRLEMIFMVNLIIAALGIIATVNGRTAATGSSEIEWVALGGVAAILTVGLIAGRMLNRYLTNKKISKLQ